ncbi:IS630 family transposase, partial [uncultured Microscilla sp.]|uniref:IS630 family transposase n=1 Tax=uncultured Microscilla sp. TaxID=432653 RepID=UPI00262041C4
AKVEELTGIKKSPSRVRVWMHKVGMKYQKTAQIPSKACPEAQAIWKTNVFEPLREKAKSGEITLLFGDAMHCVMGVFLSFLWSFKRLFIKSSPGRKRLNVVGAVNAISKKVSFMTNITQVNAETMISFLDQLRQEYGEKPIYLILDNARYQHCRLVKEFAQALDIHLVFLPPYSPNLNIIERLWKWVKKKCLYAKYYENFDDFRKAIETSLEQANELYQTELESLLSLKFQSFHKS